MFSVLDFALVALAIVPSIASPVHNVDIRAATTSVCSHDNLLRIFLNTAYSSSASIFCSSYITAPTTTVSATITAGATVTATPIATITITPTVTTSVTVPTTTTIIVTSTETDDAMATLTVDKRGMERRVSSVTPPDNAATYGPSRLSSACTCLITPSTVTVTNTKTASTSTSVTFAPTTTATVTAAPVTTVVTAFTSVTDTVSTATTTTATVTTSVPASCNNAGLQFAFQYNPYFNYDPPVYSNFDPTYFKTETPSYTGVTTYLYINGNDGDPEPIYSSPPYDPDQTTVNHRGYLYATQSGTYTFTSNAADDINEIWLGATAYSGYNRENSLLENVNSNFVGPASATVDLVAGNFYPLRIIFGNAQGGAVFSVTITAPDGSVVIGPNSGASDMIVQYSCDETTAPPYPSFGSEF